MRSLDSDRDARDDEKPPHRVRITRPFYLGMYEVTQAEYERVMVTGRRPSRFTGDPRRPVEQVRSGDMVEFLDRLGKLPEEKMMGAVYRLPTEAEWEYACRASTGSEDSTRFNTGNEDTDLDEAGWYWENGGKENYRTHTVGAKPPNAWGLHDMHGNVWEWCADWYDPNYYAVSPEIDPQGPAEVPQGGSYRVIRGGSWRSDARYCRSAYRNRNWPENRNQNLGFRVARSSADGVDSLPDGTGRFPVPPRAAETRLGTSCVSSRWRTLGTALFFFFPAPVSRG